MHTIPEFTAGQTIRVMHTNDMVKQGHAGKRVVIERISQLTPDGTKVLYCIEPSTGETVIVSDYNCSAM